MNNVNSALASACIGKRWVTVTEAARHYRVSRKTIYEACREGQLEHTRIRTTLRIPIDENESYLTVAEVADMLMLNPSTVYEACSLIENPGAIKHIRIRSRIRIPVSKFAVLKEKARGEGDGQR